MKLKNEMHRLVQALKKKEKKTTTQKVKSVNMSTEKKEAAQIRNRENEKMGSLTLAFSSAFMRTNSFLL
jgi:hypothetical protein